VAHDLAVLDVYRRHRDLKPAGIAELNEGGQQLAQALAEEVATLVDALSPNPFPQGEGNRKEVKMPDLPKKKVGIVACSGEEMAEGTVTRLAALRVLEQLRPNETVTICLPLFLAGGEGDRAFARFYPTIAIDGCDKRCAARGTEMYSGKPAASVVVTDVIQTNHLGTARRLGERGCKP